MSLKNANQMRYVGRDVNDNYILRPLTHGDNRDLEKALYKDIKVFDIAPNNPEKITALQRNKAHAMIADINENWGEPFDLVKDDFKLLFCRETGHPWFSLADCTKETATMFIEWLVAYCFENDIDFYMKDMHLTMDINKVMFFCAATQRSFVTARRKIHVPLEIHHVNAVGSEKRSKTDHRGRYYMILEHQYHVEIEMIGYRAFCEKYHVGAIKLTDEQILKYKLMSKKQMDERDSDPNYEIRSWQLPE